MLRTLGRVLRERELRRHGRRLRRPADRRRAGRHDRAPLRDRVRPRHDDRGRHAARPRDRHAGRRALDAQPPAALRRRRDLARSRRRCSTRTRSTRSRRARARDLAQLAERGVRGGGVDPGEVYEIARRRQRDDDPARARDRPRSRSRWRRSSSPRTRRRRHRADFGVPVHPRAPAFAFPSLGAYVGGDIVAGMLATGLTRDRASGCSSTSARTARSRSATRTRVRRHRGAGRPAFEAAQIRCGMRAADGAIEGVKIADGELALQVIGDVEPVGMCGSGLVDCVAELVGAGPARPLGPLRHRRGARDRARRSPTG